MIPLGETALSYVGKRPYAKGADLLRWFELLRRRNPATSFEIKTVKMLRIAREIRCDGTWILGESDADAVAKLDFLREDGTLGHAELIEGTSEITSRIADYPSLVLDHHLSGDFAGQVKLGQPADVIEFLNALVDANKQLHVSTLQKRGLDYSRIRLVYVQDMPLLPDMSAPTIDVTITCAGERLVGGRQFSLCHLTAAPLAAPVKICFVY